MTIPRHDRIWTENAWKSVFIIGAPQPNQLKLVEVETVDHNKTWVTQLSRYFTFDVKTYLNYLHGRVTYAGKHFR